MSDISSSSNLSSEGNTLDYIVRMLLGNMFFIDIVRVEAIADGLLTVRSVLPGQYGGSEVMQRQSIGNIPFLRLQRGKSAVRMDPEPGDIGLMAVCDKDISDVKVTRSDAPPASLRRHNAADGIYLTGISLLNQEPTEYIHFTGRGVDITSSGNVTINGLTVLPDGRLQLVNGVIVDTHVHGGVQSGGSNTQGPQ